MHLDLRAAQQGTGHAHAHQLPRTWNERGLIRHAELTLQYLYLVFLVFFILFSVSCLKLPFNFAQCKRSVFILYLIWPTATKVTTREQQQQLGQHPQSLSQPRSQSASASLPHLSGNHCKFLHGRSTENLSCSLILFFCCLHCCSCCCKLQFPVG